METREGHNFGTASQFDRNKPYEIATSLPSDVEQRGVRFPASWRPDEISHCNTIPNQTIRTRLVDFDNALGGSDTPGNLKEHSSETRLSQGAPSTTIQLALEYQFRYSMAALVVLAVCMAMGAWLAYSGAVGKTTFAAQLLSEFGMKIQMTDAGPGVVLFVVALIAMIATRFDIKIDK